MPRIQGLFEKGPLNQNQQIKDAECYLFSLSVAWKGVSVGDLLFVLEDSATGQTADTSKHVFKFYAPTANGVWSREWTQGKRFETGLFYREGIQGANIDVVTELTAK